MIVLDPVSTPYAEAMVERARARGVPVINYDVLIPESKPDVFVSFNDMKTERAISKIGKSGFAGVYAETDSIAGGAIAAMKTAGIDPSERPTTGRNASVQGVQRILAGEQYMTASGIGRALAGPTAGANRPWSPSIEGNLYKT